MDGENLLFPFEFHLIGTPVSSQGTTASKERWKSDVGKAARDRIVVTDLLTYLEQEPLAVTIYFFPTAPMVGDVDNIVKPIMDALKGVTYLDDNCVERVVVQRFEPEESWEFSEPSDQLATALNATSGSGAPRPVVYVLVTNDLSWRRL